MYQLLILATQLQCELKAIEEEVKYMNETLLNRLKKVIYETNGNITATANILNLSKNTVYKYIHRYNLEEEVQIIREAKIKNILGNRKNLEYHKFEEKNFKQFSFMSLIMT